MASVGIKRVGGFAQIWGGAFAMALAAVGLAGCADEVAPLGQGSMSLAWEISPRGCEHSDVTKVEAVLKNAHRDYSDAFDCESGSAVIEDIEPGNYELVMLGLERGGKTTFSSIPRIVTVRAEAINTTERLRLTAKPATLAVEWVFANGRVCGSNNADQVQITVFDAADFQVAQKPFTCNDGSGKLEGLVAGEYFVEAIARGGRAVEFKGVATTVLKRGEEGFVRVTLE